MNHYLIDFENVGSEGLKNLNGIQDGDEILIFYSDNRRNVALDVEVFAEIFGKNITCQGFKVVVGSKNALDFQLSSYLGYLIGKNTKDQKYRNIAQKVESLTGKNLISQNEDCYFIVSNDKGYDCLCKFWKEKGVEVERIATVVEDPELGKNPIEESGQLFTDRASFGEIMQVLSAEDRPIIVWKIFNTYKTKADINRALSREFRDSDKVGIVYKKLKPLLKEKGKV